MVTNNNTYKLIKDTAIQLIPNCQVYLFGSRVNSNETKDSDYDLLIVTPNNISMQEKLLYKSTLRKLFAKNKLDADLIIESKNDIKFKKNLIGHIVRYALSEGILL